MSGNSVVDLVTERMMQELPAVAEAIAAAAIPQITDQVIDEVMTRLGPAAAVPEPEHAPPPAAPAADARDRAWRTTVQGIGATIVVAVLLAVAELIGTGTVDLTGSGGWKAVAGTAGGAALMAVMAYVQRLIDPPKDR